jgi:hypothetical protein
VHTLHNVRATITPANAEMLLLFPVLNQIGRFTVDSANNKLIFGRPRQKRAVVGRDAVPRQTSLTMHA